MLGDACRRRRRTGGRRAREPRSPRALAAEVAATLVEAGVVVLDRDHASSRWARSRWASSGRRGSSAGSPEPRSRTSASRFSARSTPRRRVRSRRSRRGSRRSPAATVGSSCSTMRRSPRRSSVSRRGSGHFSAPGRLAVPIGAHRPDAVFHGHAHHGRSGAIGTVPVHNVARHGASTATSCVTRPGGATDARAGALDDLARRRREAREDRITTSAQALAYSLFLAIPATFLVLLGVFSLVADARRRRPARRAARGGDAAGGRRAPRREPRALRRLRLERDHLTVVGLALALWTTTSAATALDGRDHDRVRRPEERGFVRGVSWPS